MNGKINPIQKQELRIASLLHSGTWLASTVVGVGLAWQMSENYLRHSPFKTVTGVQIVTVGVGLFISLPILRLLFMLLMFLRERDYTFSLIAAIVLGIIFTGFVVGLQLR